MTLASAHLVALAASVANTYVELTGPRAILLTGSAAERVSDYFSDLDLVLYHDRLPEGDSLSGARDKFPVTDIRVSSGEGPDAMIVEEYAIHDIECQVAHCTVESWERNMDSVLESLIPATQVEKAIIGLQGGTALHGNALIGLWQERAATYPEALARATIEHYLRFFPLWLAAERWDSRDATIFYHQMLVETSLNLLGVLSGLNHLYYSPFQFKRLHRFIAKMLLAPNRFADRLDEVFAMDSVSAGNALERLVDETLRLIEVHLPTVDTTTARRHIGVRHTPWTPSSGPTVI